MLLVRPKQENKNAGYTFYLGSLNPPVRFWRQLRRKDNPKGRAESQRSCSSPQPTSLQRWESKQKGLKNKQSKTMYVSLFYKSHCRFTTVFNPQRRRHSMFCIRSPGFQPVKLCFTEHPQPRFFPRRPTRVREEDGPVPMSLLPQSSTNRRLDSRSAPQPSVEVWRPLLDTYHLYKSWFTTAKTTYFLFTLFWYK